MGGAKIREIQFELNSWTVTASSPLHVADRPGIPKILKARCWCVSRTWKVCCVSRNGWRTGFSIRPRLWPSWGMSSSWRQSKQNRQTANKNTQQSTRAMWSNQKQASKANKQNKQNKQKTSKQSEQAKWNKQTEARQASKQKQALCIWVGGKLKTCKNPVQSISGTKYPIWTWRLATVETTARIHTTEHFQFDHPTCFSSGFLLLTGWTPLLTQKILSSVVNSFCRVSVAPQIGDSSGSRR